MIYLHCTTTIPCTIQPNKTHSERWPQKLNFAVWMSVLECMIVSRHEMANAGCVCVCDFISLFSWRSRGPPAFIYTSVRTALPFQRSGNSSYLLLALSYLSVCPSTPNPPPPPLSSFSSCLMSLFALRHNWMRCWFPSDFFMLNTSS